MIPLYRFSFAASPVKIQAAVILRIYSSNLFLKQHGAYHTGTLVLTLAGSKTGSLYNILRRQLVARSKCCHGSGSCRCDKFTLVAHQVHAQLMVSGNRCHRRYRDRKEPVLGTNGTVTFIQRGDNGLLYVLLLIKNVVANGNRDDIKDGIDGAHLVEVNLR